MNISKFKAYTKLISISVVLLAVLLFMLSNAEPVTVKFLWWTLWQVPLYAFIFVVANGGIVVFFVSRKLARVIKEVRQLRREENTQRRLVDQIRKDVQDNDTDK